MRPLPWAKWCGVSVFLCTCLCCSGSQGSSGPPSGSQLPRESPTPAAIAHGPDLVVVPEAAEGSWYIAQGDFAPDDCAVQEKCVRAAGTRRLLRFDAESMNVGDQDLVLGDPTTNPAFVWSPCHQHYHYDNYMLYELLDATTRKPVTVNGTLVIERKQGFCLEDDESPSGAPGGKFDCTDQGISVGWTDTYDSSIDCQWLDITGVPPGNYLLQLVVNPDHALLEKDFSNNTATIPVSIPPE